MIPGGSLCMPYSFSGEIPSDYTNSGLTGLSSLMREMASAKTGAAES